MILEVNNIRGVDAFALDLEPGKVTHLIGANAAGKTTVASSLAACLARNPDPLRKGIRRTGAYVRRGAPAEEATATLAGDGWSVQWHAATGRFDVAGDAPQPPALAVMAPEGRGKEDWIRAIEGGPPTASEIVEGLCGVMGPDQRDTAERMAKDITESGASGWDVAEAQAKERRARARAAWESAVASTGERGRYGVRVASGWVPKGWSPHHESLVPETCTRAVAKATAEARGAATALATLQARISDAEAVRAQEAAHQRRVQTMRDELQELEIKLEEAAPDRSAEVAALEAELKQAEKEVAFQATCCEQVEDPDALQHRYRDAEAAADRAKAALDKAKDHARQLRQSAEDAEYRLASYIESADDEPEGTCPTCGQVWASAVDHRREREEKLRKVRDDVRRAVDGLPDISELESESHQRQLAWIKARGDLDALQRRWDGAFRAREAATKDRDRTKARRDSLLREIARADERGFKKSAQVELLRGRILQADERTFDTIDLPDETDLEMARTEIDRAEAARRAAQRDSDLVTARIDATSAHNDSCQWDAVARFLSSGSTGYRARRLRTALEKVRRWLARIAPWVSIGVDDTLNLTVRGSTAADGSQSELWAAEAALRITVAAMRNSPVCVLDGADVLTDTPRAEMLAVLSDIAKRSGVAVLVTESRDLSDLRVVGV